MSGQMLLPGIEPKPELTDRVMLVVLPDAGTIAQIEQRRKRVSVEHALRGRPIIPGRLHVSLLGLSDHPGIPQRLLAQVGSAADRVALRPFNAAFTRAMSFSGKSRAWPVVLTGDDDGVEGLVSLQRTLVDELRSSGVRLPVRQSFTPHLTLLYASKRIPDRDIEPIAWTVREFALVRSEIGKNLPYTVLGTWSLAG